MQAEVADYQAVIQAMNSRLVWLEMQLQNLLSWKGSVEAGALVGSSNACTTQTVTPPNANSHSVSITETSTQFLNMPAQATSQQPAGHSTTSSSIYSMVSPNTLQTKTPSPLKRRRLQSPTTVNNLNRSGEQPALHAQLDSIHNEDNDSETSASDGEIIDDIPVPYDRICFQFQRGRCAKENCRLSHVCILCRGATSGHGATACSKKSKYSDGICLSWNAKKCGNKSCAKKHICFCCGKPHAISMCMKLIQGGTTNNDSVCMKYQKEPCLNAHCLWPHTCFVCRQSHPLSECPEKPLYWDSCLFWNMGEQCPKKNCRYPHRCIRCCSTLHAFSNCLLAATFFITPSQLTQ
ncbi:hypothetical protein BJ741DRAFT_608638 [Chytriomyces cf. hyalinus JEL632]|nr:hypothetical protein BJ741DRAFT_608638 [Chytriomyces cf. hyalinus JEL632]